MDQHRKRRLRRWALQVRLRRRDRLMTLFGSLIIFATFIAKEAIGENLKDLVSQIEIADYISTIRREIASEPGRTSRLPDNMGDIIAFSDQLNGHAMALAQISEDLAEPLQPDKERFLPEIHRVTDEADEVTEEYERVRTPVSPPTTKQQFDDMVQHFFRHSGVTFEAAQKVSREVFDDAHALKEQRETFYNFAKWVSYILFVFGWGLTFYGQLSGKGETPAGPQA